MAIRTLPVNQAMLNEKNDASIDSSKGHQGRTSEFVCDEYSDRKERDEEESKHELKPLQRLPFVRLFWVDDNHCVLDQRSIACRERNVHGRLSLARSYRIGLTYGSECFARLAEAIGVWWQNLSGTTQD